MPRQALLAALIVSACLVATAFAKPYSTSSETTAVGGGGEQGSANPECPDGRTAIAGGFETEFRIGDALAPATFLTTFRRDQDAWFFSIRNQGAGDGTFTGHAYCSKQEVSISFEASRLPGGTALASNAASCPKKTVALSGGYVSQVVGMTATNVPFALRRISKRSWEVGAANVSAVEAGLTAYVVCTSRKLADLKLKTVRADVPLAASGGGSSGTATANCRAGQRVVSGGFEAPSYATGVLVHGFEKVGKRGWQVTASAQTPVSGTVTAYAYCIPA